MSRGRPVDTDAGRWQAIRRLWAGPATMDEMGVKSITGIRKLLPYRRLHPGVPGSADYTRGGGASTPVYYLDRHDPAVVLEKFLGVNESWVMARGEYACYRLLSRRLPPDWKPVLSAAFDEREWRKAPVGQGGGDGGYGGECPVCGREYDKHLPVHLREDCDGGL